MNSPGGHHAKRRIPSKKNVTVAGIGSQERSARINFQIKVRSKCVHGRFQSTGNNGAIIESQIFFVILTVSCNGLKTTKIHNQGPTDNCQLEDACCDQRNQSIHQKSRKGHPDGVSPNPFKTKKKNVTVARINFQIKSRSEEYTAMIISVRAGDADGHLQSFKFLCHIFFVSCNGLKAT